MASKIYIFLIATWITPVKVYCEVTGRGLASDLLRMNRHACNCECEQDQSGPTHRHSPSAATHEPGQLQVMEEET